MVKFRFRISLVILLPACLRLLASDYVSGIFLVNGFQATVWDGDIVSDTPCLVTVNIDHEGGIVTHHRHTLKIEIG